MVLQRENAPAALQLRRLQRRVRNASNACARCARAHLVFSRARLFEGLGRLFVHSPIPRCSCAYAHAFPSSRPLASRELSCTAGATTRAFERKNSASHCGRGPRRHPGLQVAPKDATPTAKLELSAFSVHRPRRATACVVRRDSRVGARARPPKTRRGRRRADRGAAWHRNAAEARAADPRVASWWALIFIFVRQQSLRSVEYLKFLSAISLR